MGRPPCCDKVGIKKGPWTLEEDMVLVSYIQEHGPGNWKAVPPSTGLLRCSKSCRLRWANYLRPGLKHGNFTHEEEKMIIQLQGLMGNKWAAIASYLPQRTDNDIKNYWNTHIKKKFKKFQSVSYPHLASSDSITTSQFLYQTYINNKDLDMIHRSSSLKLNHQTTSYASSSKNISRLLKSWKQSSPKHTPTSKAKGKLHHDNNNAAGSSLENIHDLITITSHQCIQAKKVGDDDQQESFDDFISHEEIESLLSSFKNMSNIASEKSSSSSDSTLHVPHHQTTPTDERCGSMILVGDQALDPTEPSLSLLEKWLTEDSMGQGLSEMGMSPIFC